MRIALLAHLRHPIAPPFQGGMEAHAWHLASRLAARGHDVTLFASGDSAPPPGVLLHAVLPRHYDADFPWHRCHGTAALNAAQDAAFASLSRALLDGGFDVVHNNTLHRYPPRLARAERLPTVTSLHVPPFDVLHRAVLGAGAPWSRFTVTSRRQRAAWWPAGAPPWASVLPNGIDLDAWPFVPRGDGTAVWSGRIAPNKGAHLAVAAATRAGIPLTLCGAVEDQGYFDARIRPHLGGDVRYAGHLSGAGLAARIGAASVLLFTPLWDEPFGLAAIEAMACGLPVAATEMGAVREVIGECGRYAPPGDVPALARALTDAMTIPRRAARDRARALYPLDRMVDGLEREYRRAVRGARDAPPREAAAPFRPHELAVAPATHRAAC